MVIVNERVIRENEAVSYEVRMMIMMVHLEGEIVVVLCLLGFGGEPCRS